MIKINKTTVTILIIFNILVIFSFVLDLENTMGLQFRKPDMDYFEIYNGIYYYTSYEQGLFTYNPDTEKIVKLSDDRASHSSIVFQNGYIFLQKYRGNSIIRMDIDGGNRVEIVSKVVSKYVVTDKKVFFLNKNDNKLYSCDLNGDNLLLEMDSEFAGLRKENNYIYLLGYKNQVDIKLYYESGYVEEIE